MYYKRQIDSYLTEWAKSDYRKPLLLRGARQVGKSSSIKKLSENFENYVEINFEKERNIHSLFDGDLNVREICKNLTVKLNKPITPQKTLLFFDEIQACPNAISALRFFYEDYPELHVVAAGSLLEFALEELPSFGVGRIRSIYMYPFSFSEFMNASGEKLLWNEISKSSPEKPLFQAFHLKALDLYKKFLVIGGMPAVVSKFIESQDIIACQNLLNDLINSLKTDFAKYRKRTPELRISTVFQAIVDQAGSKFNYSKVEQFNIRQVKESVELLQKAGLVISIVHTSANGIPLGAQINSKKQKFMLFDTGIFQRLLGLELSNILFNNNFSVVNKGFIAEQMVGLELLKASPSYDQAQLYYWHREAKKSYAEVDYIIQRNEKVIPVEVKSGTSGKMQSLYLFLKEKQLEYGVRTSLENFEQYDKIKVYPLYAVENLIKVAEL